MSSGWKTIRRDTLDAPAPAAPTPKAQIREPASPTVTAKLHDTPKRKPAWMPKRIPTKPVLSSHSAAPPATVLFPGPQAVQIFFDPQRGFSAVASVGFGFLLLECVSRDGLVSAIRNAIERCRNNWPTD